MTRARMRKEMMAIVFEAQTVPRPWINTLPASFNAHGDCDVSISEKRRHREAPQVAQGHTGGK